RRIGGLYSLILLYFITYYGWVIQGWFIRGWIFHPWFIRLWYLINNGFPGESTIFVVLSFPFQVSAFFKFFQPTSYSITAIGPDACQVALVNLPVVGFTQQVGR